MQLLPAIDIRGGRCVRLLKGDFDRETRYDIDPVELAQHYAGLGARWLHVVDLDGAARGEPVNLDLVKAMHESAGLNIQLGGGVRSRESLVRTLAVAQRIVIGSLAITEPDQVEAWLEEFGAERITLALDVRLDDNGTPYITTHGWRRASETTLWDALGRFQPAGIEHVLCTDVGKDGALEGPNLALYSDCVERWPEIAFQASGGVRDAEDLAALAKVGMTRAVSGKALLEGRLSSEEIRSFLPNE
ncbi:MAG: 1-(5-phosphoribosyl)-5-[(5-phosphoribosylamino)methylideneamino] imidazole-4-carboxamide isomerase [Gammaproteobacteria bacterium]